MTDNEILSRLTCIFRDVFDDQTLVLEPETTADDVLGWDSMFQVVLAAEIGHRFGMKFKTVEVGEARSVRHLIELIRARVPASVRT